MIRSLRHLAGHWRDTLLPGSCLLCKADSRAMLLCLDCAADLPLPPGTRCPQCAEPTTHGERCGACLKGRPHFDRTVTLFRYDFPVDRLIHALKYHHQLAVAPWLGARLAQRLIAADQRVMPLPLHADRLRQRGFNQSLEIARAVGQALNLPVDASSLSRHRATPPQADLPPGERHKNVRGAFSCATRLNGEHIVLIDDVMTTGATVNECARVLKLHGAAEVTVAVAARALKD
jgi:ComF family protein